MNDDPRPSSLRHALKPGAGATAMAAGGMFAAPSHYADSTSPEAHQASLAAKVYLQTGVVDALIAAIASQSGQAA